MDKKKQLKQQQLKTMIVLLLLFVVVVSSINITIKEPLRKTHIIFSGRTTKRGGRRKGVKPPEPQRKQREQILSLKKK